MQYLDIDKQGLHLIESKAEATKKALTTKNVDELHSFIGITTYAKYVNCFGSVV